jgi:hypothetical protein
MYKHQARFDAVIELSYCFDLPDDSVITNKLCEPMSASSRQILNAPKGRIGE